MRCLVTGATGYIGTRLVPVLLAQGHEVRCLARDPGKLAGLPWLPTVDVVRGDVLDEDSLRSAMSDMEVVYYLVHSLGRKDFAERDRRAAMLTARAARARGVGRIVYLGGLRPAGAASEHLGSRAEVGDIFLRGGVPTAVLQAAVIIGSGSVSFEMLRYLTENLPVMIAPRWMRNRVQPIAVSDVLHYLAAATHLPSRCSRRFDLGGPDILTYADMMRRYAAVANLRQRLIIGVPLLTPTLSAYWINLVTPVPRTIATPLIKSLINEAVCREHDIDRWLPPPRNGLTTLDDALRHALARIRRERADRPMSTAGISAAPAEPLPTDPQWSGGSVHTDERVHITSASPQQLWHVIEGMRMGRGRARARLLVALRGWLDRVVGTWPTVQFPGRRRTGTGATGDWWRVEDLDPGHRLSLCAELALPGRARLELTVESTDGHGARYRQRAVFVPRGLGGHLYWWAVWPLHNLVFGDLARTIIREAEGRR